MVAVVEILIGLIGAFLWEILLRTPIINLLYSVKKKLIWRKILNLRGDLYIAKSAIQIPAKMTRESDNLIERDLLSKFGSDVNIVKEDPYFDFNNPNTNIIIIGSIKYNKYAELLQRYFSTNFEYITDSYEADPLKKVIKIISQYGEEYISSSDLKNDKSQLAIVYGILFYSKLKNNKKILWISGIHGQGTIGVYKYLIDSPDNFINKISRIPKDGKYGNAWLLRIQYDQNKKNQDTFDIIENVELIGESTICLPRQIKNIPKYLICDLGNVIFFFDRFRTYRALGHWFKLPYNEIATTFEKSNLLERYEKGDLHDEEFYHETMSLFNIDRKIPYELFCEYWSDIFWPNRNMIAALTSLRNEIKLILLSNTNNLHFKNLKEHYREIISIFEDRIVLSYKERIIKPDIKIFKKAMDISEFEITCSNCIYVDDNVKNVDVAATLGMKGIVFYSYTQFVYSLREFGLYIS